MYMAIPHSRMPWANSRVSLPEISQRQAYNYDSLKPYFGTNAFKHPLREGKRYVVYVLGEGKVYGAAVMTYRGKVRDPKAVKNTSEMDWNSDESLNSHESLLHSREVNEREHRIYLYKFESLDPPHRVHKIPLYRALQAGRTTYTIKTMTTTSSGFTINPYRLENESSWINFGGTEGDLHKGRDSLGRLQKGIRRDAARELVIRRFQRKFLKQYYDPKSEVGKRRLLREFAELTKKQRSHNMA